MIIKQTSNSLKIKNGAVVKYPEMLKFFPDDLKSRKMCKHPVKKLLFLIQYVWIDIRLKKCVKKLFLKMVGR